MLGVAILDFQLTFRDSSGNDKRPGFNAIRNDCMLGAAQRFDAFNLNRGRARASHAGAHFIEQLRQVSHFRLTCGVVYYRFSACQRSSHH